MIDTSQVGADGESLIHVNAVRLRVTGQGNLRMTIKSLNSVKTKTIPPLAMLNTNDKEPVKLTNFISQRVFFRIETIAIDEIFRINRIVIFAKPMWSQYPGQ